MQKLNKLQVGIIRTFLLKVSVLLVVLFVATNFMYSQSTFKGTIKYNITTEDGKKIIMVSGSDGKKNLTKIKVGENEVRLISQAGSDKMLVILDHMSMYMETSIREVKQIASMYSGKDMEIEVKDTSNTRLPKLSGPERKICGITCQQIDLESIKSDKKDADSKESTPQVWVSKEFGYYKDIANMKLSSLTNIKFGMGGMPLGLAEIANFSLAGMGIMEIKAGGTHIIATEYSKELSEAKEYEIPGDYEELKIPVR